MNLDGGYNQKYWSWSHKNLVEILYETEETARSVLECSRTENFTENILDKNGCYKLLPDHRAEPFFLKKSLFYSKLKPIFEIFGSSNVHLVDGENLVENPEEEYGRIQEKI